MAERVLIISYWGANDALTAAAVGPHARALLAQPGIGSLILVTIEREAGASSDLSEGEKLRHLCLKSKSYPFSLLNKASDFLIFPKKLQDIAVCEKVDRILAVGAMAGALASILQHKTGLPFYVASYEPHADYMAESGTWKRLGLKYLLQQYWEKQQLKFAAGLMSVSEQYRQHLIARGVSGDHIRVVPCTIDLTRFQYCEVQRTQLRAQLQWTDKLIGVYVGKYGDLYYQEEAFRLYKTCFDTIPNFRLMILSPQPVSKIEAGLVKEGIDLAKVFTVAVPHSQVPTYLSAADFAFATIKAYPSARFCSPVKIGEYWANGLPVLLTEGVGDESEIIRREGGGALFNLKQEGSVERALRKIQLLLQDPAHRRQIPALAEKYRSPDRIREAYAYFFGREQEEQS